MSIDEIEITDEADDEITRFCFRIQQRKKTMSEDTDIIETSIVHKGVAVTAAEYLRQHVEPRGLKPEHVPRVQKVIGRKQVTHVVGRTSTVPKSSYHAVRLVRTFDSCGNMIGHEVARRTAICRAECVIVNEMVSFDGCCESIPDARQCEKCLARLNGEVV